jgi:hypothetical protein
MRISPTSQVCSALLCSLLILTAGCANPSSQSPGLDSLSISATPSAVTVGGAVTLQALAHLSDGTTQDVTSSTLWTLSNPALGTVSKGVLTSKAPGTLSVQGAYVEAAAASSSSAGANSTLSASAQVTISAASTGTGPATTTPSITWNTPAAIPYGTALSGVQLNAVANVPGTFAYTPTAGTVLNAGSQTLTAAFTPSDTNTYSAATATVQLTVAQAAPVITWPAPAAIEQGTALGSAQLDASANVPGTFSYSPAAGAVLGVGIQPLTVTFSPSNTTNYSTATANNSLTVLPISSGDLDGADNWEWNHDPGTPGSSTGSTLYPVTSPSLDNAARGFFVTYSDKGGEIYHLSFAKDTTVSNFVYDTYIYLTNPSQIQNIEMDMNQVMSDGRTVILATQCAGGSGTFEYTTVSNGGTHWHPSNIPCNPKTWTANTWHHVQIASHRDDSGNVTYDWVNLDGTAMNFNNATGPSAESLGWEIGDLLLNFQLDGVGNSGTITAYLDELTIDRW